MVRRKVSAPDWRIPRRMTLRQWRRLPFPSRWWYLARAQCNLLGYWRDCKNRRCRRARRCLEPQPCYWDRKAATPPAEWARADARCKALRSLLGEGAMKRSEGFWLF